MRVGRFNDPIVHPFTLSSRRYYTRSSQIRKMTRDLWLIGLQDFDKETDTYFVFSH